MLILRDPRAVAVSFYHHLSKLSPPANFNGNWEDFTYFFNNGLSKAFNFRYSKLQ
ncbi:MAG: sulfotransferase domain-containing protein [Candidatus Thiodiazotropha sp.]